MPYCRESIFLSNSILLLHLNHSHALGLCNQPHQSQSHILDLIVLMQQTNMALHCDRGILSEILSEMMHDHYIWQD